MGGVVAFEWFGLPVLFFSGAAILAALLVYVGVFKDVHGWLRPRPPDVLMVWGPDGPGAHLSRRPLDDRPAKLPYWTQIAPWHEIENADPSANVYDLATGVERAGVEHRFEIGEVPVLKAGRRLPVTGNIPADKYGDFIDITTFTSPQLEFSYWLTLRDASGRRWRGVQTPPEQAPTWRRIRMPT